LEKKSLLSKWLNRKSKSDPNVLGPRPDGVEIPMSYGQQRIWFLQQLFPENPFYHYAELYRLKGTLDVSKVIEGVQTIVKRHAILRTTFKVQDGRPIQLIHTDNTLFGVTHFDFSNLAVDQREQAAQKQSLEEASKPFDLVNGPTFRIATFQLEEKEHLLLIALHHIVTDKWSMNIFRKELASIYHSLRLDLPLDLPVLPFQYADFAYWRKSKGIDAKHIEFWLKKLSGKLPILQIPLDHPRPTSPTFKGNYQEQLLPEELSDQLKQLSKGQNTTLFVLLLSAFKVLLYRYSNQVDLLVGTPIANRDQKALDPIIGFFNDTVVLRSDLSDDPSFIELVQRVNATTLEAFAHKNTPFEALVRRLNPERYVSANPIFQVMFILHVVPEVADFGSDLDLEYSPFDFGVTKFDLTLYVSDEGKQLRAIFEYANDLFELDTIIRMQGHLKTLLEDIVAHPEERISKLSFIPALERRTLLNDWNQFREVSVQDSSVVSLFVDAVRKYPNDRAVTYQAESLTYAELYQRAESLAQVLRNKGVKANVPVGLLIDRSLDMMVGIWGILMAGGHMCLWIQRIPQIVLSLS